MKNGRTGSTSAPKAIAKASKSKPASKPARPSSTQAKRERPAGMEAGTAADQPRRPSPIRSHCQSVRLTTSTHATGWACASNTCQGKVHNPPHAEVCTNPKCKLSRAVWGVPLQTGRGGSASPSKAVAKAPKSKPASERGRPASTIAKRGRPAGKGAGAAAKPTKVAKAAASAGRSPSNHATGWTCMSNTCQGQVHNPASASVCTNPLCRLSRSVAGISGGRGKRAGA